jgi:uncharacterized membrane protein YdjX (TVP38/TMEM64 family)
VDAGTLARIVMPLGVAGVMAAALLSPLGECLTLATIDDCSRRLADIVAARPIFYAGLFLLACAALSALCFPVAPTIGLAAGALFGFWTGLAILVLGFTIGSTLACCGSRYLLRSWVKARLGGRLALFDRGFERHGAAYLLALRFNPLVPYWLVNLAMGVTRMRLGAYIPLTFLGLLPALAIYANAGSRLAAVHSIGDILSPGLLASLFLLSLFPLLATRLGPRLAR